MALSPDDREDLSANWRLICSNTTRKKGFAIDLFIKLFEVYPSYKSLFSFAHGKTSELRQSPQMRAHASRFINAFDAVMDNLDDPQCLVLMLKAVVDSHTARGITLDHFGKTLAIFKAHLYDNLGSAANRDAWEKLLGTAAQVIGEQCHLREQEAEEIHARREQCRCFRM